MHPHAYLKLTLKHRVLIATIRDMGICPCPRCTIKKESFYALGTTGDTADRNSKARRDNDNFRSIIQEARDNIYQKGYALQSEPGVERLLKESSFVPTIVSNLIWGPWYYWFILIPERVFTFPQGLQL